MLDYIARAIGDEHLRVVEVNLRHEPWWPTRLYLLAALAADYTLIRPSTAAANSGLTSWDVPAPV